MVLTGRYRPAPAFVVASEETIPITAFARHLRLAQDTS